MDDKDLNLLKNIPYLMEKIEELENRIKQLHSLSFRFLPRLGMFIRLLRTSTQNS